MNKTHWIDDSIQIADNYHPIIQDVIDLLEEYDKTQNDLYFDWLEVLDTNLKNFVIGGSMTEKEWQHIMLRYEGKAYENE